MKLRAIQKGSSSRQSKRTKCSNNHVYDPPEKSTIHTDITKTTTTTGKNDINSNKHGRNQKKKPKNIQRKKRKKNEEEKKETKTTQKRWENFYQENGKCA